MPTDPIVWGCRHRGRTRLSRRRSEPLHPRHRAAARPRAHEPPAGSYGASFFQSRSQDLRMGQEVPEKVLKTVVRLDVLALTDGARIRAFLPRTLRLAGREPVADPGFAEDVPGTGGVGLDLLAQLGHQGPEMFRLLDRV